MTNEEVKKWQSVEAAEEEGAEDASVLALKRRLEILHKELDKENSVKEGLERVLDAHKRNKMAYVDVQNRSSYLAEDNRAKIAALRMQIDRIELALLGDQGALARCVKASHAPRLSHADDHEIDTTELATQDLLYRLYKEVALADGAKNLIRTLTITKKPDHKTAKEVQRLGCCDLPANERTHRSRRKRAARSPRRRRT